MNSWVKVNTMFAYIMDKDEEFKFDRTRMKEKMSHALFLEDGRMAIVWMLFVPI